MIYCKYGRASTKYFERRVLIMAWKNNQDFRNDYPNGYQKDGDVYDGNGNRVGYVTGDGDYRINNDKSNDGQLYSNKSK